MDSLRLSAARWTLLGLIVALAAASVLYRLLEYGRLKETAALFIGLPTLLAVTLVLFAKPRSITGFVFAGVTLGLLLSGVLLGEGLICILMAAPLFYLVAGLVALVLQAVANARGRGRDDPGRPGRGTYGLVLLPFLLLSLEGVHPALSFPRNETITRERIVAGPVAAVEATLGEPPRFDRALPPYLRLGFPRPVEGLGAGLALGDRRAITFQMGPTRTADLVAEVVERAPGRVRFRVVADATPIAGWLTWQESEVTWTALDAERTHVQWTLRYARRLDPAWYFGPWERYGVGLAADYLLDTAATPRAAR